MPQPISYAKDINRQRRRGDCLPPRFSVNDPLSIIWIDLGNARADDESVEIYEIGVILNHARFHMQ